MQLEVEVVEWTFVLFLEMKALTAGLFLEQDLA